MRVLSCFARAFRKQPSAAGGAADDAASARQQLSYDFEVAVEIQEEDGKVRQEQFQSDENNGSYPTKQSPILIACHVRPRKARPGDGSAAGRHPTREAVIRVAGGLPRVTASVVAQTQTAVDVRQPTGRPFNCAIVSRLPLFMSAAAFRF